MAPPDPGRAKPTEARLSELEERLDIIEDREREDRTLIEQLRIEIQKLKERKRPRR